MTTSRIDAEFEGDPRFAWTKGIDTMQNRRQPGIVGSARSGKDGDHDVWLINIQVDFGGGAQEFVPCFAKKSQSEEFVETVKRVFRVFELDDAIGKRCYALRCFPGHGGLIEGLEDFETGRHITLTGWWRDHVGPTEDPLERAVYRLRRDVDDAMRKVASYEAELVRLKREYVDWTK